MSVYDRNHYNIVKKGLFRPLAGDQEPLMMGSDIGRMSKGLKQHPCYFPGVQLWKLVGERFKQNDGWVPTLTTVPKWALQRQSAHQ